MKKIIIDTSKNLNYNLSCINIKVESENNNEKKSNEKMLYKTITDINDNDIKSEDEEKSESNNSENNSLVTTKKIKENDDKDKKGKNNDTDKIIEKEMKLNKNNYDNILKSENNINKYIKNVKNEILKKIPNYPILIGNKIDLDYYSDIYRYLYVNKNKLDISSYPESINKIKIKKSRDNKKRDFRKKAKKYYLDNEKLYMKLLLTDKNKDVINKNVKIIKEENYEFILQSVPEQPDILKYLNNLHKEDGHKGIASLRCYLFQNNIYLEGS